MLSGGSPVSDLQKALLMSTDLTDPLSTVDREIVRGVRQTSELKKLDLTNNNYRTRAMPISKKDRVGSSTASAGVSS